ncbi:electron transfer flavoprotein-quinone oxidoreductase [Aromatoleum tolulyticum]|uniref:Protein FixC n=1 Tax=Aromatoleum tolulyticum TaxID=34027 RepID=A0A1N6YNN2_9RHOO|nr:FAD-dependent oxidoreductase [Aromatoleum tolulyticum]SIR16205.1 electron transfer flavoprotein-quinone oxidoreductase [Aromatoleum tolulyticum]
MAEKFDLIVVGAGMAGNAAAYTAAKAGLKVLQIERGEYPGSKNVQGAILYADAIEKIIPDFRESAPLERHLIEQRVWVLDDDSYVGSNYRSEEFNREPYNRYTIIRAQFDRWFSEQVTKAGGLVICETTVQQLLMDGQRVVGVRTDRKNGDVFADCVILADGVNSLLAKRAGFHEELKPKDIALAVKEIHFLPQETIEARFNIGEDEGVVIEMAGKVTAGMMGTAFLYTNKESITLGIGCMLSDFKNQKITPYQLLEQMKEHPAIKPLLAGSEMKEYAAHLIPEGGYNAMPPVYGDGWMIAGDAGMFVNGIHREGSNLAMTTGQIAAQTLIDLKTAGKECSAKNLKNYRERLDQSFVMKDLKKYRHMPEVFHKNSQFFTTYPELLNRAAHTMVKVDGIDKKSKEREIRGSFVQARSLFGLLGDAFKLWRAFQAR